MQGRSQQTVRRPVQATGIGFLTGRDVTIRFLPAEPDDGILFQRVDVIGAPPIPARIEFAVPRQRRTAIEHAGVAVEMTEHVMAALAGLQVDNCLVTIDAPEPPGFDGSSLRFAEMLLEAEIVSQGVSRELAVIAGPVRITDARDASEITYRPVARPTLAITYHLDYGPTSPIRPQELTVEITPETFMSELAFSRTFVLREEVAALQAAGYGVRTTPKDLLVFGPDGPIDNALRAPDECARHKILDCLGDFALIGKDVQGHFCAYRSGHHQNREMVRGLVSRETRQSSPRYRAA